MALTPGSRLGPYEISALLGVGGMGEVYRARDTKLNRDVAIKILPDSFATDPDRLARFTREAQVLASLNHPNIAHVHGLEESNGVRALVMELVEGEDLSQRIGRGAIPLDDALPIAKQIAEALEAAHEHGIIHRDLKPANIKVRPDGTVKVLDFGLAKAMDPLASSPEVSRSPTITTPAMTHAGIVLGTAAYMSPEQAKGTPLDKRTDVWAFGCVLYEVLAGVRAFEGDDVSDTMASVLKSDPDWERLPVATPLVIRRLLRRCLIKDRKRRLPDIAVARLDIDDALSGASLGTDEARDVQVKTPTRRRAVVPIAAAIVGAAIAIGVGWWARPRLTSPEIVKFTETLGDTFSPAVNNDQDLTISPDGRRIAYIIGASVGTQQVMVRALDQFDAVPIGGVGRRRGPFFSPEGRWVGYSDGVSLLKVPITGGPPVTICKLAGLPRGASWGVDGTIVFATNVDQTGLFRVAAEGGTPETLTTPDAAKGERLHEWPEILPGGRAVLFTIYRVGETLDENTQVAVLDLATRQWKVVIPQGSNARYTPSGHLVYAVAGSLRAVRFDLDRLEVRGEFVPVIDHVLRKNPGGQPGAGAADFSVAGSGTLVYVEGGPVGPVRTLTLVWVNRNGREEPITAPPRAYFYARLSPDGARLALDVREQQSDIWIWDFARQNLQPLTNDASSNRLPIWTPDSKRVAFSAERDGVESVYWQAFDGAGPMERLSSGTQGQGPMAFSPDGKQLVISTPAGRGPFDLGRIDMSTPARTTTMMLHSSWNETNAEISPDGHWLAYQSNESGQDEVWVRPFPNVETERHQVSRGGGTRPLWSRTGRELFYYLEPGTIMAVPVRLGADFTPEAPQLVVKGLYARPPASGRHYDVSGDGQRFLLFKEAPTTDGQKATAPEIHVVLNWTEELKRQVPTK